MKIITSIECIPYKGTSTVSQVIMSDGEQQRIIYMDTALAVQLSNSSWYFNGNEISQLSTRLSLQRWVYGKYNATLNILSFIKYPFRDYRKSNLRILAKNEYFINSTDSTKLYLHINNITDGIVTTTIVDIDKNDLELVSEYTWHVSNTGYIRTSQYVNSEGERENLFIHNLILGKNTNLVIDHMDRNKLNNCRSNIRITTQLINNNNASQRSDNTSGVTGVYYRITDKRCGAASWIASWHENGVKKSKYFAVKSLGFDNAKAMAIAYRQEQIERIGCTNGIK